MSLYNLSAVRLILLAQFPIILTAVQIFPTRTRYTPSPMMPILSTYLRSLLEVPTEVRGLTPRRPDGGLILTSAYQVTGFSNRVPRSRD